ncbi:hypothetical protein NM688_g7511 [Phlebia brevispora]|uniref:Uncharacterized protein n=1 Tax=Phlebia brevispora TaxID=194682 RepID=A0ACC1S4H8_9APHY|nr:hypothetical protein NM688_g7511 [Phlebia brevispora]
MYSTQYPATLFRPSEYEAVTSVCTLCLRLSLSGNSGKQLSRTFRDASESSGSPEPAQEATVSDNLKAVWYTWSSASHLYGFAKYRRRELKALLECSQDLLQQISDYTAKNEATSEVKVVIVHIQHTFQSVKDLVTIVGEKEFLWNLMNGVRLDDESAQSERSLENIYSLLPSEIFVPKKHETVAIKWMHVEDGRMLSREQRQEFYHDLRTWSELRHPNVLPFYGACLEAEIPYLLMKYCLFGTVDRYLEKYPDADRMKLAHNITSGLTYLHSQNIIHADIKGVSGLIRIIPQPCPNRLLPVSLGPIRRLRRSSFVVLQATGATFRTPLASSV